MSEIPGRVYIDEMAERLNRRIGTLRSWEMKGHLPKKLLPKRGERNRRYWTETQAKQLENWAKKRYTGCSLPHYNPSDEEIAASLEKQRTPRQKA